MFQVNVLGLIAVTKQVLPKMLAKNQDILLILHLKVAK